MVLKHKNRELIRFDWIQPFGVKNLELNRDETQFLPLEFRDKAETGNQRDLVWALEDWLLHRTAPMNRRFFRDLLVSMGFNPRDPRYQRRLIEFSLGLSLNDVHWVTPDDSNKRWSSVNLYRNEFPESVASLAFSGLGRNANYDVSTSPEYTTNGVLAKCWRRIGGSIKLYKSASDSSFGREPFSEFYASQLASSLKIPHVEYALAQYKQRLCSVCPLFTSERFGFVPAGKLMTREELVQDPRFADIFLLDAIIMNDDRHLGNFGFLIDNANNEICGIAPAFDNGHAFFSRPSERFSEAVPALYDKWEEFPGLDRDHAIAALSKLRDFHLRKDRRFNLPIRDFNSASSFLNTRIDNLISYYESSRGGLVKLEFTGPRRLLEVIRRNPGLRTRALAKIANLTERTAKRYLAQLKGQIVFKGAPKTGGYYVK